MSKGSGVGRGLGGTRLRASDVRARRAFERRGLRGVPVPQGGLRPESFAYLRAGGKVHGGLPRITVQPGGRPTITDGRHRTTIARERGERTIRATVQGMGPSGGIRWRYTGLIKI